MSQRRHHKRQCCVITSNVTVIHLTNTVITDNKYVTSSFQYAQINDFPTSPNCKWQIILLGTTPTGDLTRGRSLVSAVWPSRQRFVDCQSPDCRQWRVDLEDLHWAGRSVRPAHSPDISTTHRPHTHTTTDHTQRVSNQQGAVYVLLTQLITPLRLQYYF